MRRKGISIYSIVVLKGSSLHSAATVSDQIRRVLGQLLELLDLLACDLAVGLLPRVDDCPVVVLSCLFNVYVILAGSL